MASSSSSSSYTFLPPSLSDACFSVSRNTFTNALLVTRNRQTLSTSPDLQRSIYDVFLSFSGNDTRNTFTSHLLAALDRQGFSTFHDDTKLVRGQDICSQLPRAISESRVSIVVFSMNYAASGWCLDELVNIMECRRDFKQIVLPVFYDVDPADVRRQRGFYSKAFDKHEARFKGTSSMKRVARWRQALTQAANLSGWHLLNVVNGDEAKLIKIVVNEVMNRLDNLYCDVADHPVGIDYRVQKVKKMLKLDSDDVSIVAIWGVGGIGKTTIAKAVFNSIRNKFEGSSFLADVREMTKTSSGVVHLQKQLLCNILQNDTHSLDNYHHGIDVIKQKLCHKRVLLVLDDVDHVQQLKMLAINRDFLCPGSKIIITTRAKSSLTLIQVDSLYQPQELSSSESLKLFSHNAFKTDHPEEGYLELSHEIVAYAQGLPLALEVLGSNFSGISKAEWVSLSKKLQKYLPDDIQGKLKISFDSLDKTDQDLFLDIAFFFIGEDKDFAVKLLDDTECFPEIGIGELTRRCLIRVDVFNKLRIHNLLRDMARQIVHNESFKEPAKRSRLRGHEEVLQVLRDSVGRERIEGLYLELPDINDEDINVVAFADMCNLKFLHLNYLCHLRGTNITTSRKLKWLCWHHFPLACFPDNVYMKNLVALDLQYSRLKQMWKEPKRLDKLRFLNLSYSNFLTKTPDLSGLNNLEELLLHDCENLVEVHHSIGCLDKLTVLNLANCKNLKKVPVSILMLKSLKHLDLSGYSIHDVGESRSLFSRFQSLLPNPQECVCISAATIQGLGGLSHLRHLDLSGCNLSNVPSEIGNLTLLNYLNLSGNKFSSIQTTLSNLSHLNQLYLGDCHKLRHIPALPNNLKYLDADNCLSLESESVGTQFSGERVMGFLGCPKLDVKKIESDIIGSFQDDAETNIYLPGGELHLDLDFQVTGSRLSFVVPEIGQKIRGWVVRIVVCTPTSAYLSYRVFNTTKGIETCYPTTIWWGIPESTEAITCLSSVGLSGSSFYLEGGDEIKFSICATRVIDVRNCGIRLIHGVGENSV